MPKELLGPNLELENHESEGHLNHLPSENGQSFDLKRKKGKVIWKKSERPSLILGVDIHMDEVMKASKLILVGREKGMHYSTKYIPEWLEKAWSKGPDSRVEVINLA